MNLFWLDTDPTLAAQAHQDVHVGKMLLEGVQLLCTAFEEPAGEVPNFDYTSAYSVRAMWREMSPAERVASNLLPYARTKAQYNHPCAVWTRASRGNFDAAIALCQALAAEYRYRFDKFHASEAALAWVIRHRSAAQVPDGQMTPYAQAMPKKYSQIWFDKDYLPPSLDRGARAYRAYYRAEKRGHWRSMGAHTGRQTWVPAK